MSSSLQVFEVDIITVNEWGEIIDRRPSQARFFSENLGGVTLEMVEIPGGKFLMGLPPDESKRKDKYQSLSNHSSRETPA